MKVEIPELKRCCCCIPLRQGLLAWGYIKLAFLLFLISIVLVDFFKVIADNGFELRVSTFIELTFILMLAADLCHSIIFIVGGHRKSPKLLHVYYIFNIVLLVVYAVLFTVITTLDLYFIAKYGGDSLDAFTEFVQLMQYRLLFGIMILGIQVYIILLIRSEAIKLRNCSTYKFSNLKAQAEGAVENGTKQQNADYTNEPRSNENAIDNQSDGIIYQSN